jgi:pyruvate dehydrogenase E1 component alpha subunit
MKLVSEGVNALRSAGRSFLVITHYQRLLDHIKPDVVHIMAAGRIIKTGGPELALEVENNGYAESTSRDYAVAVDSYVDRAAGFGLPGVTVDGLDFFAVYEAAGEIIKRAREGGGPALLECKMFRMFGHFEGDQQTYRAKGELEDIRVNKDCIKMFSQRVTEAGVIGRGDLDAIDREIVAQIQDAVASAKAAPLPTAADLLTDVYYSY